MDISIRKATFNDAEILTKIHLDSFKGFFMSKLGFNFLRTYYSCSLKTNGTICFIAQHGNQNVGFVLGCKQVKGHNKKVFQSNLLTFGFAALCLFFKNPYDIIRLAKNMTKKSEETSIVDDQNYAQIELIGISESVQNKGIGYKLFCYFEEELKTHSISKLSLTTDKIDNEKTLNAYNKWGFELMYEFVSYPKRRMLRLIKNVI